MPRWGILIVALVATALVAAAYLIRIPPFRPSLTCSIQDAKVCDDTMAWLGEFFDPGFSLDPDLPGRITAIEVKPTPEAWKTSRDPGFQAADWAAVLHRDGYDLVVAACSYNSEDEIYCLTEERPFPYPSS